VPTISQLLAPTSSSLLGETFAGLLSSALVRSELVGDALAAVRLSSTFADESISEQLMQVAKVINASVALQTERAAFITRIGSFDTHSDNGPVLEDKLGMINAALRSFVAELKAQGRWEQTVVLTVSEFGRTITSNGLGTDHGWGGNHFLMGGAVRGGTIHGRYPDDLTSEGPLNVGRGRIIPTTPFEGVWKGVAEWWGVERERLPEVLPNLRHWEGAEAVFSSAGPPIPSAEALFYMPPAPPSSPPSAAALSAISRSTARLAPPADAASAAALRHRDLPVARRSALRRQHRLGEAPLCRRLPHRLDSVVGHRLPLPLPSALGTRRCRLPAESPVAEAAQPAEEQRRHQPHRRMLP